ncbi:MAG TPA: zf-HC2 domain-containing protein [Vicinamibacteria bacterium]|nr:zf-HC2 domain-containing protein [Vicinamibacteria bacterium]
MKCTDLYRRLSDHGEGLLDAGDCAAIEHHLRECAPCGELRRDLEALARLCRESPRPRLPDDVRRRIETLLRKSA